MENFASKTIAALLTVSLTFACDLDLDFRCTGTDGHYVIINPDTDTYIDVEAYHENGDECDATIEGTESDTLTVSSCGTVSYLYVKYHENEMSREWKLAHCHNNDTTRTKCHENGNECDVNRRY